MGKNKQQKIADKKRSDEEKEKYYRSVKTLYENGNIPQKDLDKLLPERKKAYLQKELSNKFGKEWIDYVNKTSFFLPKFKK